MKKLLLASVSAAAILATPVFAQSNTSDITQGGNATRRQ